MPNADTMGSIFRDEIEKLRLEFPNRVLHIENFGKINYFTAMNYSKLLIGNSSSGILEAATFGKYVVNVGDRQKGRLQNSNVLNSNFNSESILENTIMALNLGEYTRENIYVKKDTAQQILSLIKKYHVKARKV
jgi:GDP/UDP-N,N'-diacetylbacillosamine 2-epimerase (hydrolysing)